ncbi:MAG: Ig-like domain-containing protein [Bacteroidota bacterium]
MKTKRKRLWMTAIVASLLLVTFIVGCKKDEYVEVVGVCPLVISTDPANAATNVPLSQIISATFNEKMDPATITQASFTLTGGVKAGVPVSGTLTYNNTNATLNFVPTTSLVQNTTYTGTVKSTIKDMNGNALQTNYVWTFSTGVVLSPTVIATDPVNSASGVFINKVVTATFSVPMNPLTVTSTNFYLKQGTTVIAGTGTYSGTTASFTSTGELLPNTVYTGIITAGAKNVAGTPLENEYTWSFTTGSLAGPTVILTDPTNNATGVVLEKTISATFSMAMNPLTLTNATFTVKQGLATVVGNVTYTGTTAYFDPTASLIPNALYVCTITSGAKNVNGTALTENYVWSFTAGSFTAPTVISTDPANLATGVLLNKKLTATFSVPMDPLTLSAATFTLKRGKVAIAGTVSYTGTTATFAPTTDLKSDTIYTATITTGAKNLAGLALEADYVWTFTTLGNASPPVVISTDPNNNALNVDLLKTVTATFSMPMNASTINATTFTMKNGTISIGGTITYSGSTATFDPLSMLLANTLYTCTVTNGVQNAAGVTMVSDYVWTFTTSSAVVAPVVINTDPLNNAIDVPLNKTVSATFDMQMDPTTLTSASFMLKQGSTPVAGTVTYSGTTALFNPTNDLVNGLVYTAAVTTGVKNLAGVSLVNDYIWSFTTLAAVVPPVIDLGSAAIFGAFGGNAGVTNQGINTVVNGAIATTAASTLVTGFHDGLTGDVYTETPLNVGLVTNGIFTAPPFPGTATSEAIATLGLIDANAAYLFISPGLMPGGIDPGAGELGGLTLAPGVYKSASGTFKISNGPLTLDAQGDPNATWVFQTAAGLTVGIAGPTGARSVVLINGALPKNVFWYVGSAATINGAGGGIMSGTIIATAGVTFSTPGNAVQTVLNGRAISLIASVTMVNTTVNVPAP